MPYDVLDSETLKFFQALRKYKRACQRYIQGRPSPELAKGRLESAFTLLMDALDDDTIRQRLDIVIQAGLQSRATAASRIAHAVSEHDMNLEMEMSFLFGLKVRDVSESVQFRKDEVIAMIDIASVDELVTRIEDFHGALITETELARTIDIRSQKKRRKRNIGQAVTSILFGSGCAVLNTYALAQMPPMAASYGASMAAFHAAVRDLVGERPKD